MPAKKIITREDILSAALDIMRESGIEALNVRAIAKRCNCSTQPIYLSFNGIEEIKNEINVRVLEIFRKYMDDEVASGNYASDYKAVGMGYIRFAKEEKELFKYAMMHKGMAIGTKKLFDDAVLLIMKNYGLYQDAAAKLQMHMWIFVHGIASIFATDYVDIAWENVSLMVTDAYLGAVKQLQGDKNDN